LGGPDPRAQTARRARAHAAPLARQPRKRLELDKGPNVAAHSQAHGRPDGGTVTSEAREGRDGSIYLVYGENGARLLYEGADEAVHRAICEALAAHSAGYVAGYQFVGRQRYEVRCYLDAPPSPQFIALRTRRDLFDFGW